VSGHLIEDFPARHVPGFGGSRAPLEAGPHRFGHMFRHWTNVSPEKSPLKQHSAASVQDTSTGQPERLFSGPIGTEYQMLDLICPAAAAMSKRVGSFVAVLPANAAERPHALRVFEIGCGTGRTTLALLESREDLVIRAADNEPAMLDQARGNLSQHIGQGRVQLIEADALTCLL